MILLPQNVWKETTEKLDKLLQLMGDTHGNQKMGFSPVQQTRIPLIQFKKDIELQRYYGLTYAVVRRLANDNLLRSYCDSERRRNRWTTHEDIMNYLNQIKEAGISIK
jgi:hypothetical protein